VMQAQMRAHGAQVVDAKQDPEQVARDLAAVLHSTR
jgi:hypothetical protein